MSETKRPAPLSPPSIDGTAVLEHTKVLASDEFEGRAPGTKGEELTVNYIAGQFKKVGLQPGYAGGSYIQKIPLVGITPNPEATLIFRKGTTERRLKFKDDFVAWTKRPDSTVSIARSELVFAGYGIEAPEFGWNDFKGMDFKEKTLVVLVGDPPVPDPSNPEKLDPKMFGGSGMTYYGRWTYKYEMGQKLGAAGVLIVHETGPAGYPFAVVQNKVNEQFSIPPKPGAERPAPIEGWVPEQQARALFSLAGRDFNEMKRQAVGRDFRPVPLGVYASLTLENRVRQIDSRNVVGKVEGSDPALRDECVVYSSHWDHLGLGAPVNGDTVYHGALDNAVAVGGLIEIARAFAALPVPPKRTIVFLATTAEEQLLLGATYYVANPLFPLDRTLADINLEGLNVHGRTRDLTIIGLGLSDLDDYAREAAMEQRRALRPDPEPEKGMYYRADHFAFAQAGVPALEPDSGVDYLGKPADYGLALRKAYVEDDYHKPSDKVKPSWDLSGGVEDLKLFYLIGFRVAQAEKYPEWKPGTEFKARRDKMLAGARK